jgi:tRNA(Ile)-lysidine synthase
VAVETLPSGESPSAAAAVVLDRRLSAKSRRPVAVAVSGGGDSVALLLLARAWAARRGRALLALSVDHQLQAQSRAWSEACAALAGRLGTGFQALAWTGEKPSRSVPAEARAARHRLLAQAARAAGAQVILMGHTADDLAEARAMRQAGSTTPEPREWSPSPAWPEGRGVFLLRPLLGVRRAALREWLRAQGEGWIEDPANADPRYARARARAALAGGGDVSPQSEAALVLAEGCRVEPWAEIRIERVALRRATTDEAERLVGLACVCGGGGARLPPSAARARLTARLLAHEPVVASLAGARVTADPDAVRITREAGEWRRSGLDAPPLAAGESVVWDGRFEVTAAASGLAVRPLAGLARRLPSDQQRTLAGIPAAARPALPAILDGAGVATSPLLGASPAAARSLVGGRLKAAAGLVQREPD